MQIVGESGAAFGTMVGDWFGELVAALGSVRFVGRDGEIDYEIWFKKYIQR